MLIENKSYLQAFMKVRIPIMSYMIQSPKHSSEGLGTLFFLTFLPYMPEYKPFQIER